MAKVNFERVEARITSQNYGTCYEQKWARCDLSLPAAELRAIAGVLDSLPWIEQAAEQDGALFIRQDHKTAWLLQERAFHAALGIARRLVAEALHRLRTEPVPDVPRPIHRKEFTLYHNGSYANLPGKAGSYVMPEGHYGPAFVIVEDADGRPCGHFLTRDRCDDKKKPLAAALLAALFPELGIETWQRLKSYGEVEMIASHAGIENYGAAAYAEAQNLIVEARSKVAALQWGGAPSAFLDEDDDARDLLLEDMRAGAAISRVRRQGAEYNDVDGVCVFSAADGSEIPHYIVTRLQKACAIKPLGWPLSASNLPDAPLEPLVFSERAETGVLTGRSNCVSFQAFQFYCPQRRREGWNECAHSKSRSENCSPEACPITIQAYAEDVGDYGLNFRDDPAFNIENWERDAMVRALHPNTERSMAWLAAGEQQVEAVVNQVLHAMVQLGIEGGRHIFGAENDRAVRKAIAEGHLVVEQEMPGFGIVVRLSDTMIAKVEKWRTAQTAEMAGA